MSGSKRVAVVGGGMSGIGMIKALKVDGMIPVCFEKTNEVCGTWCYRDKSEYGVASIMSTTIINHSKELGAISDHPWPAECPNYMTHRELYQNYMNFAKEFDLLKHIVMNSEVISVKRSNDYEDTGRWMVTVKNTKTGTVSSDEFDAVMICTGHIAHPTIPNFPGMDNFKGRIIHSHDLKTFESFVGQKVVVVGGGCSALDAAVEISNVASQVYLSMRTHSWIMPRVGPNGVPFDYVILRRYIDLFQRILPIRWASRNIEQNFLDTKFSHRLYGLNPTYPLLCRDPVINDFLPSKLLSGSVILRGDVENMDDSGVVFAKESSSTKVDTVVMATGYTWDYSYLEDGVLLHEPGGKFNLYKCMYPPHLKHPTLAFIGFLLPFGPGVPLGEIQIRWATYLLSGRGSLPKGEVMMDDIERRFRENVARYSPSEKMSQRVDVIKYMDDIASQFGAKPNLWKMAFTDPKLFMACVFGPYVSYQYRLDGPHKWDGAREAILTAPDRMKAPLRAQRSSEKKLSSFKKLQTVFIIAILCFLWSFKSFSGKCFMTLILLPYFAILKGSFKRYILAILLLPLLVTWENFFISYLTTLLLPVILVSLTNI